MSIFGEVTVAIVCVAAFSASVFAEPFSQPVFGKIDPRAIYGKSAFPEPLRAPEMDVESELRLDWFHAEKRHIRSDAIHAEVEYNIGYLTLEIAGVYERQEEAARDPLTGRTLRARSEGIGNVELAARYPLYSFTSRDGVFEYTLVGALEVALPSGSSISKDTEIVPQAYQLMRFGRHVTLQTSVGLSSLVGPERGGVNTLEYSAVLGYSVERGQLRVPGVVRLIPIVEIVGEQALNGADKNINRTSATFGGRIIFDALGEIQPRLGIGYVVPLNSGAREEFGWGIITSLAFEF